MVSFQSKMLSETVSCCAGPTVFWHQDIDTMHTHTPMHIDRLARRKKNLEKQERNSNESRTKRTYRMGIIKSFYWKTVQRAIEWGLSIYLSLSNELLLCRSNELDTWKLFGFFSAYKVDTISGFVVSLSLSDLLAYFISTNSWRNQILMFFFALQM